MMKPYGCHNRPPLHEELEVQVGWRKVLSMWRWVTSHNGRRVRNVAGGSYEKDTRLVKSIWAGSSECHYDRQRVDPRCAGCKHIREESP
jgi:hypothetical protein